MRNSCCPRNRQRYEVGSRIPKNRVPCSSPSATVRGRGEFAGIAVVPRGMPRSRRGCRNPAGGVPITPQSAHPILELRHPTPVLRHPFAELRHPFAQLRHPFAQLRHLTAQSRHVTAQFRYANGQSAQVICQLARSIPQLAAAFPRIISGFPSWRDRPAACNCPEYTTVGKEAAGFRHCHPAFYLTNGQHRRKGRSYRPPAAAG